MSSAWDSLLRAQLPAGLLMLAALLAIPGCGDEPTGDTTPPRAPGDLTITGTTPSSLTLRWIAPGDDGLEGTVSLYDIRHSTLPPQGDSWWDSSTVAIGDPPSPRSAGEVESLTIGGLTVDTDYYIALRAADEASNWSPLSEIASARTASFPDTIPPAAISDLAVASVTDSSVILIWTAPGDDGSEGSAHHYDLRAAPEELREENWGSAVVVRGVPSPLPSGTVQSCEVTGLDAERETWFAIRALDESANVSPISNVVAGSPDATPPAPILDLRMIATTTSSVTLEWTSPGAEGQPGDAAVYDLRVALEPLTRTSWDSASPVPGVPAPRQPGGTERFEVTGLATDTLHYFAVRTGDRVPNWSAISNVALGSTQHASGRILRVAPDGSGEFPTVHDAIAASADGDIIELEDGTFAGTGNRNISYRGKAITIRSRNFDPQACILDCEGASRAFAFLYGEGAASILQGVTIRNGFAGGQRGKGGGMLCEEMVSPTILDCIFESNRATDSGGAVECYSGAAPRFHRCRFQGNSAERQGGGIDTRECSIVVSECLFVQNEAEWGGAMNGYGPWQVTESRFRENTGLGSDSMGGALAIWGPAIIEGCVFDLNQASNGGAITALFDAPRIVNCTFVLNDAGLGAAIFLNRGVLTVKRTLIAYNNGLEAVAITDYVPPFICCDIYGNQGGDWTGRLAGQEQTEGNMEVDPRFCDLDAGDLRLRPDSPCAPGASGCGKVGGEDVGCGWTGNDRLWLQLRR
jgi:predicted outer membrane repeat protein